ncbi:MAG TPA: hypothetical protein VMH22_02955 [bacterium]|nr:hypothetical protein [bacterium]
MVSVCSEIGRGHPSYLDSVLAVLSRRCDDRVDCHTIPELCAGVSGLAWRLAGTAYRIGGRGGLSTSLYNSLRPTDGKPSAMQISLLGRGLRKRLSGYEGICMVDHPLLAHILAPVCRVAYVHGEIAAPRIAAVPGAWRTFVPLEATSLKLRAFGVKPEATSVVGLMIEPDLVAAAEASYQARQLRLGSERPLVVGLFLSGARPRPHVARLTACVESLAKSGHRAFVFPGPGAPNAAEMRSELSRRGIPDDAFHVISTRGRSDETRRTAELLPSIDVMIAAAHERTNWAVGLGLPMFALLPHIGPFARENFEFAVAQGVCLPLTTQRDAAEIGPALDALHRDGGLSGMSRAGWGKHAITGAAKCARLLLNETE